MTAARVQLPTDFAVRLHDEVDIGDRLVAGTRVLRVSTLARAHVVDRVVTASSTTSATLAGQLLDLDLASPVLDSLAPRAEEITVVVPVRDNASGVDRLLAGLSGLACVVVDDASRDPRALADVVTSHGAVLARLDHNVGPGAARNLGLRQVRTPLVAFVDSDVTVSADDLLAVARHFADPRLAAAAPRVQTRSHGRWFQRYEAAHGSLDLGVKSATVRPWSLVTYVPSACLLVRVDTVGTGFDPTLRSGEDVDLIWRLQADGHRVRHVAEVVAWHEPRSTVRAWLGRKAFYGTSAADLAERHGDRVAPAVLTPAVATVACGLFLQRRWSLLPAACAAAVFARQSGAATTGLGPRRRAGLAVATGGGMTSQVSSLLLRHWWPAFLALALVSRRARQALAAVAVTDAVIAWRTTDADLDPLRFLVARRADDLSYGAGVWFGAARRRSTACLWPRWVVPPMRRADR